jgi:hypothetical protein
MTTGIAPHADDVLQAFRLIDARLVATDAPASLRLLRDRLSGELLGDAERVERTLSPAFQLVTHAPGGVTTTDRATLLAGVRRQGRAEGAIMTWIHLEHLLVDGAVIAGQGLLHTLVTAPIAAQLGFADVEPPDLGLTTIPLAFFIRFAGLMDTEVLYLDTGETSRSVVSGYAGPDPHACLRLIDDGTQGGPS